MNNFFRNSAFSFLNNILQLIISLASGYLLARYLGASGKGSAFLFSQIYGFIQIIFSFGFGPAVLYFLKENKLRLEQINYFIIIYIFGLSLLFIVGFSIYSLDILHFVSGNLNTELLAIVVSIGWINIFSGLLGYKIQRKESGLVYLSVANFISNLFYIIALIYTLIYQRFGLEGFAYSLLLGAFVKLIIILWEDGRNNLAFGKFSFKDFSVFAKYGFYIFLSNFFLTGVFRFDTFFINQNLDSAQLGLYSVSVNVGELILLLPSAIGIALFPHMSGLNRYDKTKIMCLMGRISFLLGLIGIFILSLIGRTFINVVFGKLFNESFVPLLLLLPGLLAMTINFSYSNYFNSIGKPIVNAFIFLFGSLINILLLLIFLPNYGIYGAAISSSMTYIFISFLFIVKISRMDSIKISEFLLPKKEDIGLIIRTCTQFLNR